MAKYNHKHQLIAHANKYGLFVVKMKMDNGFLLAVYSNDGKTPIYHNVSQEISERAYDKMWMEANFAVRDYFNIIEEL